MQNSFLPQGTFTWQGLENWGCHNLGGMGTTSIQCIEASDGAKHLKIHRTTFHKKKIFRAQMLTVPSLRNFSMCDSIESSTVWSACSCLILVGVETKQIIKTHVLAMHIVKLLADSWHFSWLFTLIWTIRFSQKILEFGLRQTTQKQKEKALKRSYY